MDVNGKYYLNGNFRVTSSGTYTFKSKVIISIKNYRFNISYSSDTIVSIKYNYRFEFQLCAQCKRGINKL